MWSSNPAEPVNYKGSCTTAGKEIVDIEIAMYRNAGIVTTPTYLPLPLVLEQ